MAVTPILGITQVANSQNNKETTINDGFLRVEQSLNRKLAVDMSGGDVTLVTADFQSNWQFVVSGQTTTQNLVVPNLNRMFAVRNTGAYAVTVKTSGAGNTRAVGAGNTVLLICDGANNVDAIADSSAAASVTTFLGLTDTPSTFTGSGNYIVRVNSGATALEFHEFALSDAAQWGTPTDQYYPKWDNTLGKLVWTAAGGGPGAVNFPDLADVPSSYTGKGGYIVRVNAGATGLEYIAKTALLSLRDMTDVPDSITGMGGKLVRVNVAETGFEYVNPPTLGTRQTRVTGDPNAGFEAGSLAGWTIDTGTIGYQTVTTNNGLLNPQSGTFFYLDMGTAETAGQISKVYDLTLLATNSELDSNASIDVPYAFADHDGNSTGTMTVTAVNGSNVDIGSLSTGSISGAVDTWVVSSLHYDLPVGTRSIRITLTNASSGTDIAAAWDNTDPALTVIADATFLSLSDTPDDYTGKGGYLVRVNAGATALEFHQPLFVDSADTPANYSGKALWLVRVKASEDGLEFVSGAGGVSALDDLSDVVIASPTAGQLLVYDGSNFVNVGGISSPTTDYTLVLTDAFGTVRLNKASAINCTVPPNSSVAFPVNTVIEVGQIGTGQGTIVAGSGVTINAPQGLKFSARYQYGRLRKVATDTWAWEFYGIIDGALPVQSVTANGATTIDHSIGEAVQVSLTANSTISVSNWPAAGRLGRIILEISNTGAFNITGWPTGITWAAGAAPTITSGAGKVDMVVLTTFDGGTTIRGSLVGQNFI